VPPCTGRSEAPRGYADDTSRARQDLHHLRGHQRNSADDHRAGGYRAGREVALTCGYNSDVPGDGPACSGLDQAGLVSRLPEPWAAPMSQPRLPSPASSLSATTEPAGRTFLAEAWPYPYQHPEIAKANPVAWYLLRVAPAVPIPSRSQACRSPGCPRGRSCTASRCRPTAASSPSCSSQTRHRTAVTATARRHHDQRHAHAAEVPCRYPLRRRGSLLMAGRLKGRQAGWR